MKKEWVKLIKVGFMHGVEEPWCNNKGIAILPFIIKDDDSRYFMQTCESNPLFNKNKLGKYSSITGGVENNNPLETVYNEMKEETGIFLTKDTPIYFLGTHYASKISTKVWYYYAIDLTALNLDINDKYYGVGDDSIDILKVNNKIVGKVNPIIKNLIEIRGIGILDITKMYGYHVIMHESQVNLIINLIRIENDGWTKVDRLGDHNNFDVFFEIKVPKIIIPVSPGRNLADLIEAAVISLKLKDEGQDATASFQKQIIRNLTKKK